MTNAEKEADSQPRRSVKWRRGLLRLWVVGTFLWLLFVAILTGFPASLKGEIIGTREASKCHAQTGGNIDFACLEGQGIRAAGDSFWETSREFVLLGFSLPIMVLCLGMALGWAASGFRSEE